MTKSLLRTAPDEAADPDAELAARVARGDHPAFETLMRRHNRALFRTARAILRDDAEAEDALQEAYLQAYHTLGLVSRRGAVLDLAARVVANEALMRVGDRCGVKRDHPAAAWCRRGRSEPELRKAVWKKDAKACGAALR